MDPKFLPAVSSVSPYRSKTLADKPPFTDPIIVMIYFVQGWIFLFMSCYNGRRMKSFLLNKIRTEGADHERN